MTAIATLLGSAALALALARWLGLPAIPFLVGAGLVLGQLSPIPEAVLEDTLLLGLNVMVFIVGVELNPGRVGVHAGAATRIGVLQFLVLGALGFLVASALGLDTGAAIYMAVALAASSTLVVVRLLKQRQQLFEPLGRLVTGVLLVQDLMVILAISILAGIPGGAGAVGRIVGGTVVLLAATAVLLRWVAPWVVRRLGDDEETLLLVVLSLLFAFVGSASALGVPAVAGSFLGGVALSRFPVSALVRGQLASIGDFFNAIFFTALGALLPFPSGPELLQTAAVVGLVILVTPPLVAVIAERTGYSARPSIAAGLLLSQTSEFSLVVGLLGLSSGQIESGVFGVIAFSTLVTMVITPFLATDRVSWALIRLHPFRARAAPPVRLDNHILLVGCGRSGMVLLEELVLTPFPVVVIDDDPALIHFLEDSDITAIRGDASDTRVLAAAGADRARVVISTIRRAEENAPLLAMVREAPVFVRAFEPSDAAWIERHGGHPVLYSEATALEFLRWFREEWPTLTSEAGGNHASSAL